MDKLIRIAGVSVIILALAYVFRMFSTSSLAASFPLAQTGMGYGMVLLIGLLTSVHCIAMCGGINLSQTLGKGSGEWGVGSRERGSGNGEQGTGTRDWGLGTGGKKLKSAICYLLPAILYNSGRLVSYTVVGVVVGALGSVFTVSDQFSNIVLLIAGCFMVIMGLNMLGLFPGLRSFTPRLPKSLVNKIDEKQAGKGPLVVGILNGFMPCGPLQAMQLYALSTGSPIAGGISMFLFCLGTIPLVFTLGAAGGILSNVKGKSFSKKAMRGGAFLIAAMGVVMFTNSWNSAGYKNPFDKIADLLNPVSQAEAALFEPVIENGVQIVHSTLLSGRYPAIIVQQGIPVRWIIDAPPGSINGCNYRITIREYDIVHVFRQGENIIEFMPENTGRFRYACWMAMIRSTITVIAPGETAALSEEEEEDFYEDFDEEEYLDEDFYFDYFNYFEEGMNAY